MTKSGELVLIDWHQRFIQQANWTKDLRNYLLPKVDIDSANRILEVGCGTGAIIKEFSSSTSPAGIHIHGLDIDRSFLKIAAEHSFKFQLAEGDALVLPYASNSFDITFFHYFLMWISEPVKALKEMIRVTVPGGSVLALAEPDYGGRIDYPEPLCELGLLQEASLYRLGADPRLGRRLKSLFHKAGLEQVQTGVLGGQWKGAPTKAELESEWNVLLHDLGNMLPRAEIQRFHKLDAEAWQEGERILFVPTFYASARTSDD